MFQIIKDISGVVDIINYLHTICAINDNLYCHFCPWMTWLDLIIVVTRLRNWYVITKEYVTRRNCQRQTYHFSSTLRNYYENTSLMTPLLIEFLQYVRIVGGGQTTFTVSCTFTRDLSNLCTVHLLNSGKWSVYKMTLKIHSTLFHHINISKQTTVTKRE